MSTSPNRTLKLGVMAKFWSPGAVKTRLGKTIGMESAAALHRAFCLHLATTLDSAAEEQTFVVTPVEYEAAFAREVGHWGLERQSTGDLGTRMRNWFSAAPTSESQDRVLIGADCPLVSVGTIEKTRTLLNENEVVLGPACDGGYYLIGLRSPWREEYGALMTDMPWSSERVFELTRQRAADAGLRLGTLETMEDVDTITELESLRARLADAAAGSLADLRETVDLALGDAQ